MIGAAALLAALAGGGAEIPPASVVVATVDDQRFTDEFTCPADEICLRYPARTRLSGVRTLAGPMLPPSVAARIWLHTSLPRGTRLALIVQPRGDGVEVRDWTPATGRRVCFTSAIVDATGVSAQFERRDGGDTRCLKSGVGRRR